MDNKKEELSIAKNSTFNLMINKLVDKIKGYREDILHLNIFDENSIITESYILKLKLNGIDVFYKDIKIIKDTDIVSIATFLERMNQTQDKNHSKIKV